MELDWRLFGLAVELQLDLDLDPLILTPAWHGLKLMEPQPIPYWEGGWALYSRYAANSQLGE